MYPHRHWVTAAVIALVFISNAGPVAAQALPDELRYRVPS
jgi:hypothetical protein